MGKIRNPIRLPGKKSKYRAVRTEIDGIVFDSKREAAYYSNLKSQEIVGFIKGLVADKSKLKFSLWAGPDRQEVCKYEADFSFFELDGRFRVVDVKGFKTPIYRLKKKLFRACYGFDITEA